MELRDDATETTTITNHFVREMACDACVNDEHTFLREIAILICACEY